MNRTKTKAMTEAALLSALLIIMGLLGVYLPLIGTVISLFCPVPLIVLGLRHGLKWSILASAVSGLILAFLISPLQSLYVVLSFCILGIALGELIRRKKSLLSMICWGTVASMASKFLLIGVILLFMGADAINEQLAEMQRMLEESLKLYTQMGMKPEQIELFRQSITQMFYLLKLIFPVLFLLVSLLDTFMNYWFCRYVLKRLDHELPQFKPLAEWSVPKPFVLVLIVALICLFGGMQLQLEWLKAIGMNLQYLAMVAFLIQGIALAVHFLQKWKVPKAMRIIIIVLMFINPLFTEILTWAGIFDIFFDFRHLRKAKGDGDV